MVAPHLPYPAFRTAGPQQGFTLVELMVGTALGLLLVAAAGVWLAGQLEGQRRLRDEVRLMQELRAAADLVTRDLRRAGHWGAAASAMAARASGQVAPANPYAGVLAETTGAGTSTVAYTYSRERVEDGTVAAAERFGFRLNPRTQAIDLRVSGRDLEPGKGDVWQQLTDPAVLRVTQFRIDLHVRHVELPEACGASPCAAGDVACPPRLAVRTVTLHLAGRDPHDATVQRTLSSRLRLRNDVLEGRCPV